MDSRRLEVNRVVANATLAAFGGKPTVNRHWDRAQESSIDLVVCRDRPDERATSYGTIGLSDTPLRRQVQPPLGVELVAACDTTVTGFAPVLVDAAFLIQDHGWQCEPGAVFPDVVASSITTHLPHLYFTSPFVWEADLGTLVLENKTVTWLLAAPISEAERIFVESNGPDALEDLFEQAKIDICDINRRSVA